MGKSGGGGVGECRELPLRRFLSHLVAGFQAASYIAGFTHECYAL